MWLEQEGKLIKEYQFHDFKHAIQFINRVAEICERENHHPELFNVYNRVRLIFCTHDAGNQITDLDYKLTQLIDQIEL